MTHRAHSTMTYLAIKVGLFIPPPLPGLVDEPLTSFLKWSSKVASLGLQPLLQKAESNSLGWMLSPLLIQLTTQTLRQWRIQKLIYFL